MGNVENRHFPHKRPERNLVKFLPALDEVVGRIDVCAGV
jgi:hypothetical protein